MDLNNLNTKVGEWLKGGPEGDVIMSSRVRLARNVAGHPFVSRAGAEEIERIEDLLREKILSSGIEPPLTYYRLDKIEPIFVQLLMERHLISRDHAEADWARAVAIDDDERISVMVNEEDHLRIQVVRGGLRLEEVWEEIDALDDSLGENIQYAFSAKYGYLVACPTNVGTGMRASAMLHLPAIVMCREMEKIIRLVHDQGLTLRGLFGEGTQGSGDLYQVSNQVTLGVDEEEIVQEVSDVASRVAATERVTRQGLIKEHRKELEKRLSQAFEFLVSAAMISSEEALHFLSQVRMGVEMNLIKDVPLQRLGELLLLTLPAHLQTIEGRQIGSLERNVLRARYAKEKLAAHPGPYGSEDIRCTTN